MEDTGSFNTCPPDAVGAAAFAVRHYIDKVINLSKVPGAKNFSFFTSVSPFLVLQKKYFLLFCMFLYVANLSRKYL